MLQLMWIILWTNSKADKWEKRRSLPQRTRRLVVKLLPDDYIKLRLPKRPHVGL